MSVKAIQKILLNHKETLEGTYYVKSLYLFGSRASGNEKKNSDTDLLVEFHKEIGLFKFIELKFFLEKVLRTKIDLVTQDALLSWMRESVEKEKIRVA